MNLRKVLPVKTNKNKKQNIKTPLKVRDGMGEAVATERVALAYEKREDTGVGVHGSVSSRQRESL